MKELQNGLTKEVMEDLYINKGLTIRAIGRLYNMSGNGVRGRLIKYGLESKGRDWAVVDLTGQKFGHLTVIGRSERKRIRHQGAYWKCLCDCGTEKDVNSNVLRTRRTISCGCFKKNSMWTGFGEISGCYWSKVKTGAKSRNIELSVTKEYCWNLFLKQDRKCNLTNLEIIFVQDHSKNYSKQTASLDRIDSSKGYIEGNVQWVHKDVNLMKGVFDEEYFIKICGLIYNNRSSNV